MKRALVTGDIGFIGKHMSDRLAADGWTVTGIDIARHRSQDCRDLFASSNVKYDLVVHCAAVIGGRMTIEGRPLQVATDLAIDSDFFQFVNRTRPARVVYFSSSAAYPVRLQDGHEHLHGEPPWVLSRTLCESDIVLGDVDQPDAVYGWVKLTGEQIARYTDHPIHVFRPFSGYGSDQSLDYPFPSFIERVSKRVEKFDVWGPGTQVRDWVHVDDVCETVVKALDYEADTWNICTGIGTSMIDLAHQVMRAAGHEVEMIMHPDKPFGVVHRVGNPTKMLAIHQPVVSLAEGIERALTDR